MQRSRKAAIAVFIALFFIIYLSSAIQVKAENVTISTNWSVNGNVEKGSEHIISITTSFPATVTQGSKYTVNMFWNMTSLGWANVTGNITGTFVFSGGFIVVQYVGPGNWDKAKITFYFTSNGNTLNNVSVYYANQTSNLTLLGVFNSGNSIILKKGVYKLVFEKDGYLNSSTKIALGADMKIYVSLKPKETGTGGTGTAGFGEWVLNTTQNNLTYNFSNWNITPINGYAKAFMKSGGSFGDTIKLILLNDAPIRLLLPQLLMLAIVIFILVQTRSPLAGLAGALAMQAMFLELLGQPPSLRNSQLMFGLIVFLVAWTLWDLFYNYSRET